MIMKNLMSLENAQKLLSKCLLLPLITKQANIDIRVKILLQIITPHYWWIISEPL